MANEAYKCQVPRTIRQLIGKWATENMADTYTRDHENVLVTCWDMVRDRHPEGPRHDPQRTGLRDAERGGQP